MSTPQPSFLEKVRKSKWVTFFTGGGVASLDLFFNHVNPVSLRFKNKELEDYYYLFANENAVPLCVLGYAFVSIVFLIYVPLDRSFDKFIPLLITRVVSAGIVLILLGFILFVKKVRAHSMHITTFLVAMVFISCIISLIFRVDEEFSPLILVILFANLHCATFVLTRAISGLLLILAHALVWIFYLNKAAGYFLVIQTLSYTLFYLTAIVAAYTRELAHRRVFFVVHQILKSAAELKPYISHTNSATDSFSTQKPASPTFALPSSHPMSVQNSSSFSLNSGITSSSDTLVRQPSLKKDDSHNDVSLKEETSPNMDPVDVQEGASSNATFEFFAKISAAFYRLAAYCLPARNEKVISEIGYHESVYSYVSKVQHRFSMYFRDESREARFQEWHAHNTDITLRQILILNIVSIALMTPHDFIAHGVNHHNRFILLICRYVIIVFSTLVCIILTLLPAVKKWRKAVVTISQTICTGTAFGMAMYLFYQIKDTDDKEAENVYDLYFGYVVRFACYGLSGMGLLWMQATATGAVVLVIMFVISVVLSVPLAISPLLIVVIGTAISHGDETVQRAEFFMRFHRDEVISYIRTKEQYESPAITVTIK